LNGTEKEYMRKKKKKQQNKKFYKLIIEQSLIAISHDVFFQSQFILRFAMKRTNQMA
jgi:hypothetical protein